VRLEHEVLVSDVVQRQESEQRPYVRTLGDQAQNCAVQRIPRSRSHELGVGWRSPSRSGRPESPQILHMEVAEGPAQALT
jgi:hypothetical protein